MSWLNILSVGPCGAHHIVSFNSCFLSLLDLVYLDCIRIDWTHERVVYGATSFVHDLHFHCFSLLFLTDGGVLLLKGWIFLKSVSLITRWGPQWLLLFRFRLTTTGIKLATPPYFYRDWNWQRLPGPMACGYHIVSEKMNQCPISGYSNECSREKWENTHPCRKISIFTILKLRHCYLVSWLHI